MSETSDAERGLSRKLDGKRLGKVHVFMAAVYLLRSECHEFELLGRLGWSYPQQRAAHEMQRAVLSFLSTMCTTRGLKFLVRSVSEIDRSENKL